MKNDSLTLCTGTPEVFTRWAEEKALGARDLAPLKAFDGGNSFITELLTYLGSANPTKSLGTQALEWAVDLELMGKSMAIPAQCSREQFMQWHSALKDARFSQRAGRRQALADKLKTASWPKDVQAAPLEKGDRLGFEVKIFAESPEQFAQKIEQLQICVKQLNDQH